MVVTSGFFPDLVVGDLRPPVEIVQWNQGLPEAVPLRHIESGQSVGSARIGPVGGFDAQNISFNILNFGEAVVADSGFLSDTVVLTLNQGEVTDHVDSLFAAASGISTEFKVFNIRFWLTNKSAFNILDKADFYFR
jgi:hypothetical protein